MMLLSDTLTAMKMPRTDPTPAPARSRAHGGLVYSVTTRDLARSPATFRTAGDSRESPSTYPPRSAY